MNKEKILMCWSGGKDSAKSLYEIKKSDAYEVVALLTTVTEGYDRISMHGVRRKLLEKQAEAVGVPVEMIYISQNASNDEYESKMEALLLRYRDQGVKTVAFGDIFLEDLKQYRENNLAKVGMKGLFPIWKRDTTQLVNEFIEEGFKAFLTCIDTQKLPDTYAGRAIDQDLIKDLPVGVDPCGENGEFHSFVYNGPLFNKEVKCRTGEKVLRGQFLFSDLIETEK